MSIEFLSRLYYLYPKHRKSIEESIIVTLAFINEDADPINKKEGAIFLYKLIHRDASPEFRQQIENRDSFKRIYESKYYSSIVLTDSQNIYEGLYPKNVHVRVGFPLS